MKHKKKYIIAGALILILLLGFSYRFFLMKKENQAPGISQNEMFETTQITNQQKFEILSATSSAPTATTSNTAKMNILKKVDTNVKPVNNLSDKEKLEILNQTN